MDHQDHVNLLRDGVVPGGTWADLGAGWGAFTLALADLLGAEGRLIAVDRDGRALRANAEAMRTSFPATPIDYRTSDFTRPLDMPELDGIVMANSLHFQRNQPAVVRQVRSYLKPGGRLVVVEYNIDRGNFAVPHPVPFTRWETLASDAGFEHTTLLFRRPSRSLSEIYSAVSR
jgi:ubiquinone/menaquinone biosynthesis C-methylase UbiE